MASDEGTGMRRRATELEEAVRGTVAEGGSSRQDLEELLAYSSGLVGGWCSFVLREKYCWLIASGWFVLREKYCWLVADKPNEQGGCEPCGGCAACAARIHDDLVHFNFLTIDLSGSILLMKANIWMWTCGEEGP
jgi:hypothetical protein